MTGRGAAPRGAREVVIGAALGVTVDRSLPPAGVQARLADVVPRLAGELGGQTSVRDLRHRWRLLSGLGRTDLVLGRLLEGHLDALAILDEAGRFPVRDALYGVWASASGGTGLTLRRDDPGSVRDGFDVNRQESRRNEPGAGDSTAVLSGTMRFCSGAPLLDRALTIARDPAGALYLLDVGVRDPRLRSVPGSWPAVGMDASASLDVEVEDLPVDSGAVVGPAGFYLERTGLHLGGIGVAAVWLGGLQGLLDSALRVLGTGRPDDHALAHLGAVTVALESAAATLVAAARRLDDAPVAQQTGLYDIPADELARIALICRSAVEAAVAVGTQRLPRVVGPVALGRDADFAHRLADLEVFVRQHHGERDLAALGAAEYETPWSAGLG